MLEGAASARAKLVAMENLYMYGPTGGRPLTEDLPYAAETRKGMIRARMSRELMEADASGKVRVAIGPGSDFFGPRVLASAAGEQVFGRAVEGKSAQVAGDPDQPHTFTYAPDIGKGLVVLGEREDALGRAWHLPSPETLTTREFVKMIFEEAGKPARAGGAEDPAACDGPLQSGYSRNDRDALRVRRTVRRGPLRLHENLRRPRHVARGRRTSDRAMVLGAACAAKISTEGVAQACKLGLL
jgi:nucleoside-diphosphate-sugar epimerase